MADVKRAALALLIALSSAAFAQDDGLGDLFQFLLSPAPAALPSPSPARALQPKVPAASMERKACPLCGAAIPGEARHAGAVWGTRLDLRAFGAGTVDPPALPLCPSCRFPVYADSLNTLDSGRLRAFVSGDAFKAIEAKHFPYYYLARIQEEKIVPLRYGAYSVALSYLRASWQAEDYRDEALTAFYLEKALAWMDAFAKEVKRNDYYYATSRLLPAEILRRLKRFSEAEGRLKPLEDDPDFRPAFLQRIVKAELALVAAGEWRPQASP